MYANQTQQGGGLLPRADLRGPRGINEPRVRVCVSLRENVNTACASSMLQTWGMEHTCSPYPCNRCVTVGASGLPCYLPHHGSPCQRYPPAPPSALEEAPVSSVTGLDRPDGI